MKYFQAIIFTLTDDINNPKQNSIVFNPSTNKNDQLLHVYKWFNENEISLNMHMTLMPKILRDHGLPNDVVYVNEQSFCFINNMYKHNEEILKRIVGMTCKGEFNNNLWKWEMYEWEI